LNEFASHRKTYASYLLPEIPENRGLHGNACSKQNHWSVLSSLNPGVVKGGNMYCEHPIQLIRDLLKRQKDQTRQTNLMLKGMQQKMRVELGRLGNKPQTATVTELINHHMRVTNLQQNEQFEIDYWRLILIRFLTMSILL
jgi:hypothetical protein